MYKANIFQLCHRNSWPEPVYSVVEEGPDNRSTFTATIIVNGSSFQAQEKCSSRNEAQNQAAKLAFDQLSDQNQIPPLPLTDELPPIRLPSDARHMYKTVLQNYAQKRKMACPQYSSECEGPSLAKRYKSKVTIGGESHESPRSYRTIREAESAAATVACELLLQNDIHDEQLCIYKPLLQDLARKRGLMLNYVTTTLDMGRVVSSVEMGERTFHGPPSISKKKAEMNAAKIAYTTTIREFDLGTNYQITASESGLDPSSNSGNLANQQAELVSQHTTTKLVQNQELIVAGNLANQQAELGSQDITTTTVVQNQELIVTGCEFNNSAHVDHSGNSLKVKLEDSLSVLKSAMNGEFNPNVPVAELKDVEMNVEESSKDIEAKKCDTDVTNQGFPEATELPIGLSDCVTNALNSHPPEDQVTVKVEDPMPLTVSLSTKEATNQSPASIFSMTINQPSMEPFLELKARENETVTLKCDKLAIYPRVPNLTFPDDGSVVILPFENDKWVVVGVITKK